MSHTAKHPTGSENPAAEGKDPVDAPAMINFDVAPAQIMEMCRRNVELAIQVGAMVFEGIEKTRGIQLSAARNAQAKATEMVQALGQAASPADLWASEQQALMENMQQAMACWAELLGVVTQTNASIQRILGGEATAATTNAAGALNKALAALQTGARAEPEWMSAITAANAASQQMWQNTGKMLESFNWRMPGSQGGAGERKV